jgi:hypothetical protein
VYYLAFWFITMSGPPLYAIFLILAFAQFVNMIFVLPLEWASEDLNLEVVNASNQLSNPEKQLRSMKAKTSPATPARPIHLLIAKTLSPNDVQETIKDILSLKEKNPIVVVTQWKLFCWSQETYDLLQKLLVSNASELSEVSVQVVFHEQVLKTYFWYNYLTSQEIPLTTDYIWLLDGDVILRHMAWECYWAIIQKYRPAIAQPALMDAPGREAHNFWSAVSHPAQCVNDKEFGKLVGLETSFIEQQAPMFERRAWLTVRNVLDETMGQWNHSKSTWGIDNIWCGVVQTELQKYNYDWLHENEPTFPYQGHETCQVERVERFPERPIGCMIVQATPVVHLDTNSYDDVSQERMKSGVAQQKLYKQRLPQYFRHACGERNKNKRCQEGRVRFHRSFWMEEPCQSCRQWNCTPYTTNR